MSLQTNHLIVSESDVKCEYALLVPLTVSSQVPAGAARFTLIVNAEVPEVVTGFGLNEALVLGGRPDTLRFTELLPPTAPRLTVTMPLDPRLTVRDDSDRDIVKSADTFTVTVVACVPSGPVPLMRSVYVPGTMRVPALGATVNVELADPPAAGVTDEGVKVQLAFAGQPVTETPTEALKPFSEVTVTVELPD